MSNWAQNEASAMAFPVLWPEPWEWVRWTEEKKHRHGAGNLKDLERFLWIFQMKDQRINNADLFSQLPVCVCVCVCVFKTETNISNSTFLRAFWWQRFSFFSAFRLYSSLFPNLAFLNLQLYIISIVGSGINCFCPFMKIVLEKVSAKWISSYVKEPTSTTWQYINLDKQW